MRGDLEEVAITKSVPNWSFDLHEFSQIFPHYLAIFLAQKTDFGIC
jgi:hypothetical protein